MRYNCKTDIRFNITGVTPESNKLFPKVWVYNTSSISGDERGGGQDCHWAIQEQCLTNNKKQHKTIGEHFAVCHDEKRIPGSPLLCHDIQQVALQTLKRVGIHLDKDSSHTAPTT